MITTHERTFVTSTNTPMTPVASRSRSLLRAMQGVWYVVAVLEVVLAVRFILRLFAANPAAGFTEFVYNLSLPFVAPFQAVFPASGASGYVFEWTTLLAMAIYWLVGYGLIRLFAMGRPVSRAEARTVLRHHDNTI